MKKITELTFDDVKRVYIGRPGCMCGCRGKYWHSKVAKAKWSEDELRTGKCNDAKVIDVLVPEHSRTSCSDDNLSNSHDARCARCTLLTAQTDGYLPSNVEFDFIIRRST